MMKFLTSLLPRLMATITRRPRYRPEIEWSTKSWTYNVFRVYELVFGRAYGKNGVGDTIRAEMSAHAVCDEDRTMHVTYSCYTWESVFALAEQYVRDFLKSWKFVPVEIRIPVLQPAYAGMGPAMRSRAYVFVVIAFDTSINNTTSTATPCTITFSYTVTGSNPLLWQWTLGSTSTTTNVDTAPTYNSVALTRQDTSGSSSDRCQDDFLLAGPSTGSNTSSTHFASVGTNTAFQAIALHSYSGCNQTGQPDSHNAAVAASSTTGTFAFTTVANNCWLIGGSHPNAGGAYSSGTGTVRQQSSGEGRVTADSNGAVGTGSQNFTVTGTGAGTWPYIGVSIKPFVAAAANGNFLGFM